jgi:hypothetical protein
MTDLIPQGFIRRVSWCVVATMLLGVSAAPAQQPAANPLEIYATLKQFSLTGGSAAAENLVLKRDRGEMTFNGTFYFEPPIAGKVRGAVFIGRGNLRAEVPPSAFERENVKRMLKADLVESDFGTAILRFTDDTFDKISAGIKPGGTAPEEAQKLATEFNGKLLKELGANIASRLLVSILNNESPGFFMAQFDKGKRDRFCFLMDQQGRIPVATFGINGGEKGLIFRYEGVLFGSDVWMAFYSLADYERGRVEYSDTFDIVEIPHYQMDLDVRDPMKQLAIETRMDVEPRFDGVQAIPLSLSEGLGEEDNERLKKGMKVKSAKFADGSPLPYIQEDWEGGLTLVLASPRRKGDKFTAVLELAGDFMFENEYLKTVYYPLNTDEWYPRHGYLKQATYDMTFRHRKRDLVAAVGLRVREEPAPDNKDEMLTQWRMDQPVKFVTFGVGKFERHTEKADNVPVEFYSVPGGILAIKEDFILAELGNSLRYFTALFGRYEFGKFGAMFHPRGFGQGFPTMLLIPNTDRASKYTYSFIAHETAHQWWGNIVAWRSYRDQWLSEGFAEYSGILYTQRRDKPQAASDLLDDLRRSLKDPPHTLTGLGKGRLVDVGPIILGHRLSSRETLGAYSALIYNKGALVLRMLHFLFTNPVTGEGQPFFDMMTDFVNRHRGGWATTDTFRDVANEHFVRTPIAQKYGLKDLNWFFQQWVYETHLPTYRLEYNVEGQPDGSAVLKGTLYQENAGEKWFMPLPLVFQFDKGQVARGTVHAYGPATPVSIKLPKAPTKVELDPEFWVMSEKTSTKVVK